MAPLTDSTDSKQCTNQRYYQWHAAFLGGSALLTVAFAAALYLGLGLSWQQAAGLPLLVIGFALVAWNTHWALCFIAFSITPFGVIQREVLGVTLNLPEVLILALAVREGLWFLYHRRAFAAEFPARTLLVFLIAALTAVATGFVHGNGTVRILQDFRQFVEFLVLFWIVVQCVSGRDEAVRIAASYVLGASLIAVHGIVQQIVPVGITETQISSDFVLHQGIRSGSFYGATPLGGLMVLAVAPALGVMLSSKRRAIQGLMILCVLLCLVAIVFTRTRGSWIGLAVALALIGVSIRPSGKILATAVTAGLFLSFLLGPVVLQRLYTLANPVQDISLMARAQYYAAAAHIGRAHPVLGLGWGCFYDIDTILTQERYVPVAREAVEAREAAETAERMARLAARGKRDIDDPVVSPEVEEATVHSAYLQLFVKTGLWGLLAFLAVVTVWIERVWRGRNVRFQADPGHALFVGITAGIAGYLFHSTFENFFQWPVMAQSFWLLFGLSFLLAPRPEGQRARYGVPLLFMSGAAVVFLLFMFACLRLETLHPGHYERNAAKALEEGDLDKAIQIAKLATDLNPYEPMPFTVHARLLLLKGETDAAMAEFEKAFGTERRYGGPPIRFTGSRYYFAPARLSLGKHYANQGEWETARKHFELARAYDDLATETYVEFHPVLYEAYARAGQWARALDFGHPASGALAALEDRDLTELAQEYEWRRDWEHLVEIASVLRGRSGGEGEADYFHGQAMLAQDDMIGAVETFTRARKSGVVNANYFLGRAMVSAGWKQAAVEPFRNTPPDSVYRLAALAEAWEIQDLDGTATQDTRQAFNAAMDGLQWLPPQENPSARTLLAYQLPDAAASRRYGFTALFLWGENPNERFQAEGVTLVRSAEGVRIALEGTTLILELRHVENLVGWANVQRGGAREALPPGWIDTPRDWFDLTDQPTALITDSQAGDLAVRLEGLTWIYSVPAAIDPRKGCLVLGTIQDAEGAGKFGLQYLDVASRVIGGAHLSNRESIPGRETRAAYVAPDPAREAVRLSFETNSATARPQYSALVLIAVEPPDTTP